jgi:hypothetical protein
MYAVNLSAGSTRAIAGGCSAGIGWDGRGCLVGRGSARRRGAWR